jgi:cyclase
MPTETHLTTAKHFTIQPLAEGICAGIARMGGSALCNTGIIDLGDISLVYDSSLTLKAAEDLLRESTRLVRKQPELVVNSHHHKDHFWGNQVFKPFAQIISSRKTYELIKSDGKKTLDDAKASIPQELAANQAYLKRAKDDFERSEAEFFTGYNRGLLDDLPKIKICTPDITFDSRLSLHGTRRSAELISFAGGHSASDTILFLPADGIVFMGDLLVIGYHPYLQEADLHILVKILTEIKKFGANFYVPGHGEVGTSADVDRLIEYTQEMLEIAQKMESNGEVSEESVAAVPLPKKYRPWYFRSFYHANLRTQLKIPAIS